MNSNSLSSTSVVWWACAWCRGWFSNDGRHGAGPPPEFAGLVSHGCCPKCLGKVMAEIQTLRDLRRSA